jgi:hypothetical protein
LRIEIGKPKGSQAKEPPKLLDRVRGAARVRHYSLRTEEAYLDWVRRFILFWTKQHPRDLGAVEVAAFLSHLALDRLVSASTQNQALSALLFSWKEVLEIKLPWLVRWCRPSAVSVCRWC